MNNTAKTASAISNADDRNSAKAPDRPMLESSAAMPSRRRCRRWGRASARRRFWPRRRPVAAPAVAAPAAAGAAVVPAVLLPAAGGVVAWRCWVTLLD